MVELLEQLELVAAAYRWDEPNKLVNLVPRLKGQAFAFYRSCKEKKRTQHSTLVGELKKITPVRIQAVQSSLFHERKQKSGESVDTCAQELKVLFYKAYPLAQQASAETHDMGKSVLASQFLWTPARIEVEVGWEGRCNCSHLLGLKKQRFETCAPPPIAVELQELHVRVPAPLQGQ